MNKEPPAAQNSVSAVLDGLAGEIARAAAGRYRISEADAKLRILETWRPLEDLQRIVLRDPSPDRVKRTAAFKRAAAAAKKAIYYDLRRYRRVDQSYTAALQELETLPRQGSSEHVTAILHAAAARHVSTAERLPHVDEFFDLLAGKIDRIESIIDVGCGLMPLLFPFERFPGLKRYCACDRDAAVIDAVDAYARWRGDDILVGCTWDIASGWNAVAGGHQVESFDLALMLKLVPVVDRQDKGLLETLAEVPAAIAVITGSREAMVKRNAIGRRELRVIERFARRFDLTELATFETGDEVGLVLARSVVQREPTVA
ncbi:MAG: hypothetical protein JO220_19535 [Hyphomicrobiales bacterium]|nr:hypothetical protein [Hyphomicrobiales bacterium]